MNFKEIIKNIVHLCIVIFIFLVPLSNDNALLLLYAIGIPNLLLHWKFESNVCSLTLAERFVASKLSSNYNNDNCISCIIIDPLYNFPDKIQNNINIFYTITTILWLYVIYKLYKKYKIGEIRTIYDLFQSDILVF